MDARSCSVRRCDDALPSGSRAVLQRKKCVERQNGRSPEAPLGDQPVVRLYLDRLNYEPAIRNEQLERLEPFGCTQDKLREAVELLKRFDFLRYVSGCLSIPYGL